MLNIHLSFFCCNMPSKRINCVSNSHAGFSYFSLPHDFTIAVCGPFCLTVKAFLIRSTSANAWHKIKMILLNKYKVYISHGDRMHRTQHAREQIEQYVQEKDINEKETASGLESKTHNTSRGCRTCVVFYNALKLQISSAVTTQSINGITTPTTLPGAHIGSHRRCGEAIFGC